MTVEILYGIIGFCFFSVVQALVINGINFCFSFNCTDDINKGVICNGNIFYKLAPKFFQKHKGKIWTMPLWACVRCMSSVYGTLTYWPVVLILFGFNQFEVIVWIFDIFVLVSLTWIVYKKL